MAERLEPLIDAIADRAGFVAGLDEIDHALLERAREERRRERAQRSESESGHEVRTPE